MKAISLWQPWATLWLLTNPDEKVFETRPWFASYRGPLLVHAAKKRDGDVREYLECIYFRDRLAAHGLTTDMLAFGAIIGRVDLIDCYRMGNSGAPNDREDKAGNWEPGRYAWKRGPNPILFNKPIPYRGSQGFFEVPDQDVDGGCY